MVQFWMYAPGEKARLWDENFTQKVMSIGWPSLGDLSQFASKEEINQKFDDISYPKHGRSLSSIDNFTNRINVGDLGVVEIRI